MQIRLVSFGYGHGQPPQADLTLDVRRSLRNPHHDPTMRELTGLDTPVYQHVLDTPGARELISHTVAAAYDLAKTTDQVVTVATGCVGGRHRSVALARGIAAALRAHGVEVHLTHRDVNKPVLTARTHHQYTHC
jgi:UPF0042 nucleotide-binding protein